MAEDRYRVHRIGPLHWQTIPPRGLDFLADALRHGRREMLVVGVCVGQVAIGVVVWRQAEQGQGKEATDG